MEYTRLGRTGLSVSRTSFGALPIQRIPESESTAILRAAYEAGINFYDTANAYTDSEFKLGQALGDVRRNIIIATKTAPAAPEVMQQHLEQSLKMLRTDYIDIYQLHCAPRVYRPGEEDGVYDWLLQKKKEGAIRHISVTAHRIGVAEEALESGLYDTLQYPFSVIADERELRLAQRARELDIGFIAMKAMAGGLIQHPEVTFAFLRQYPQVVPIYGIQRMSELNQWLSLENDPPQWNEEMQRLAAEEKAALGGDFCRSCGYCMPCPMGIEIPNAARMSLLMTRAPYQPYITKEWQAKMHKIESCINCRRCVAHCPYSLDTPACCGISSIGTKTSASSTGRSWGKACSPPPGTRKNGAVPPGSAGQKQENKNFSKKFAQTGRNLPPRLRIILVEGFATRKRPPIPQKFAFCTEMTHQGETI